MKLIKTADKYNSALKRRELVFFIDHVSSGTPRLYDVKKVIAQEYNTNEEDVYVLKLKTLTGTNRTSGIAEIYDQTHRGKVLVAEHIKKRNLPQTVNHQIILLNINNQLLRPTHHTQHEFFRAFPSFSDFFLQFITLPVKNINGGFFTNVYLAVINCD